LVPSKHTGAISLFDKEYVLKGFFPKEMSKHLHRAFELRQVSDCRVSAPVPAEELDSLVQQAEAFVSAVADHLHLSPPSP